MLATSGVLPGGSGWGYEFKWDGVRAIAYVSTGCGSSAATIANITRAIPKAGRARATADRQAGGAGRGKIVALDGKGRPSFSAIQHRMHVRAPFRRTGQTIRTARCVRSSAPRRRDLMSLLNIDRRTALEQLEAGARRASTPPPPDRRRRPGPGTAAADPRPRGVRGQAARLAVDHPGRCSPAWVKVPLETPSSHRGGATSPAPGRRSRTDPASLLLGMYDRTGKFDLHRACRHGLHPDRAARPPAAPEPPAPTGTAVRLPRPREHAAMPSGSTRPCCDALPGPGRQTTGAGTLLERAAQPPRTSRDPATTLTRRVRYLRRWFRKGEWELLVDTVTTVPRARRTTRSLTCAGVKRRGRPNWRRRASLLRLWRPPLRRASGDVGLFRAGDADALEEALASMPLRAWRYDTVMPLSLHPNEPGQPTG